MVAQRYRRHHEVRALLPALQEIEGSCVIDGELCALDARGRSRFQLLQNALNNKAKLLYVVFDALFVGGKDIRKKPLLERKNILKALLPSDPLLHYSEHVLEFGKREFAKAQRAHEEGVIAKRATSLYYSGKRTREWLKFKAVHEQEVVIVGYTGPRKSRKYFGALALAVRDKARKRWVYAGHVGDEFRNEPSGFVLVLYPLTEGIPVGAQWLHLFIDRFERCGLEFEPLACIA